MFYRHAGMEVASYRYYDKNTCGFDAAGCFEDLSVSFIPENYLKQFLCVVPFSKRVITGKTPSADN